MTIILKSYFILYDPCAKYVSQIAKVFQVCVQYP